MSKTKESYWVTKRRLILLGVVHLLLTLFILPGTGLAASVVLNWLPSTDPDLAGYKVYYQVNSSSLPFVGTGATEGSSPITEGNVTSTTIDGLDPNSSYFFAVTAYNSTGVESVFSNIIEIKEAVNPVVAVTSPAANTSVHGIVSIQASASDNVGVSKVQFFVNGNEVAETTVSPYVISWDTSSLSGPYTLSAKAFDAAGNEGDSTNVSVTVVGDVTPPTVSLSAPASNATVAGTVLITANANDNINVARVEMYVDGSIVLTSNQNPVNFSWNTTATSNGNHVLSAKAYDAAGNVGISPTVTVTVLNDMTAPVVTINAPADSSTVSGQVSVSANASDNVGVSKVEFYLNSVLQATPTKAPYNYTWNTTSVANGLYTLSAKAYDAAGNLGISTSVAVNVFNDTTAPTINSFSLPTTTNSTTVTVSSFSATDNAGVTGYLITESAAAPAAFSPGWSSIAPSNYTFAGTGARTAYAWVKDAAGNVSACRVSSVLIDTTLPVIHTMSLTRGNSTVTIKASATDNIAVAKMQLYVDNTLQMESPNGSLTYVYPITYRGNHTFMVKAYDVAGNVRSQSLSMYK